MKWLFCLLCVFQCAYPLSIVFVHIGSHIPPYVQVAMNQARLFNKNCPIFLIANQKALSSLEPSDRFTFIHCESLQQSPSHRRFLATSRHNKIAHEGFWRFTSERFFYLAELIEQYRLVDVFHLENDVMLYTDLESMLPIFQRHYSEKIGATFDSDSRCIPGFVYIAEHRPIHELTILMANRAAQAKNDMELLQEFKKEHYGVFIDHLPIVMPEYGTKYPLQNALHATTSHPEWYARHFELFQSLFDAAAIGQYLGGISPRNGEAVPGFINETCLFNPSHFQYEWRTDEEGRKVPFAIFEGRAWRINNLHIHSKNLQHFSSLLTRLDLL